MTLNNRATIAIKLESIRPEKGWFAIFEEVDEFILAEKQSRGAYSLDAMVKAGNPVFIRRISNDQKYQLLSISFVNREAVVNSIDGEMTLPLKDLEIL
jgi:hypothetical protein